MSNVDSHELDKFSAIAHRWWDKGSEFRPLHEINPLRLNWIDAQASIRGKRVLDVGCGGGILAESMAVQGASVTGIDLAAKPLGVARLHALEAGIENVDYVQTSAEAMAAEQPASFDVVTCMEMLEHVPDPASTVRACAALARRGGWVFLSTINRNPKAFLLAIVGAEYLLELLPKGTHEYSRFLRPSELAHHVRAAGLELIASQGMSYNPLARRYRLAPDTSVNYLVACRKPSP